MTTHVLRISWSVSRGRDTYGYNICRLDDETTGERYRCNGGGYDMVGTVFGRWLEETSQDALREIADRAYGQVQQRCARETDPADGPATINDHSRNESGLYGMTAYHSPKMTRTWVTLDGACGIDSMLSIAKAIGLKVTRTHDKRGNTTGWVVES